MAGDSDPVTALKNLFTAASRFEKRAPKYQRMEADRAVLTEALLQAGLFLIGRSKGEGAGRRDGSEAARIKTAQTQEALGYASLHLTPPPWCCSSLQNPPVT